MAESVGLLSRKFRESVSKIKDYRMKCEAEFDVGYSSGYLALDFTNGTVVHVKDPVTKEERMKYYSIGITDGSMVMVIGRSGCGKTTWCVQTGANIVRNFETSCVFEDNIESGMTATRRSEITGFGPETLKEKFVVRNTGITAENFYERIKMIHDLKINNREVYEYDTGNYDDMGNRIYKLEPTVYILDSIALLMPEKYADESELSGQMAATAAAKANTAIFKRIIPMLKAANIMLFVINHITKNVNINPMMPTKAQVSYLKQDERLPGGEAIVYLANLFLRFDDRKLKETEGFGIAGSLVDISFIKSRSNRAGKVTTLVFNQDIGYDEELSLLVLLKNNERINGAGAFLYIGDHSEVKFNQKGFKQKLRESPEFKQIFMNEVIDVLKGQLDAQDEELIRSNMRYENLSASIMSQINSNAA